VARDDNSYIRTPSPRPSPLRGAAEVYLSHLAHARCFFASWRVRGLRLPLPRGDRDGVRGLRHFRLSAGLLTAAAAIIFTFPASAELVHYQVVGDSIPASLTGAKGDADRGRAIVANHTTGLCLLCHSGPFPDDKFQGNLAPDLAGAGARWSEGQLRLRIVDASKLNPDTIMPPFYRTDHLIRVPQEYRGKPVLTAMDVEDVVAYLITLK
jgi:L-cysteine S-thiosulfotransferase